MSKTVLVLATYNEGKKREFELLFKKLPIEIKGISEFQKLPEFEEEGSTFEEIAIHKAKFISKIINLPVLADDSGLIVEALNGQPGIFSARYAGRFATDRENNLKLLQNMKGKKNRNAAFYCSVAMSKPTGHILTYTGKCSGLILYEPLGKGGFGYDPLFFHPVLKKSFAQLSIQEKNKVSHRGQVMRKIKNDFKRILVWLKDS